MVAEVKWGYEINHNFKIQVHHCYTYGQVDSTVSLFLDMQLLSFNSNNSSCRKFNT
jgi:hypothetical protein